MPDLGVRGTGGDPLGGGGCPGESPGILGIFCILKEMVVMWEVYVGQSFENI